MALNPGQRLGPYEVLSVIGAGGMGQVYRARDTKLGRDVALKILPESFAFDPDRVTRFEREARTLASLNHPGIAHIYDAGHTDGVAYLAMELVEGDDLAAIIARGAIPIAEALPLARQIAEALENAHEAGVVHRDLKPANIKVRADGVVKVLDFGLAKALSPETMSGSSEAMNSPTLTARATQLGVILGTAAYMAPEQAKGKPVDRRADVWAFGTVLFEMLTGRRAFAGDDISETLASVLRETPAIDSIPKEAPPSIRRLLRRCLEKDRAKRLDSMAAARFEIDDAMSGESSATLASGVALAPPPSRGRLSTAAVIALIAVVAALSAGLAWFLKPAPPAPPAVVTRFSSQLPDGQAFSRTGRRFVAVSADGSMLAYIANNQIYLRSMHELEARPIRGSEVDPIDIEFSPDGRSIAFFSGLSQTPGGPVSETFLRRIDVKGGAPVQICPAALPFGIRWQGNRIVYSDGTRILSVLETGGAPDVLFALPKESGDRITQPSLVAGGRALLYSLSQSSSFVDGKIMIKELPDGEPRALVAGGTDGRVTATGHLVWMRDDALYAQAFDEAALQLEGGPVAVVEGVRWTNNTGAGQFGVSSTGTLVFVPGTAGDTSTNLVWVDRSGREEQIGAPSLAYTYQRLSPDGTQIVANSTDTDADIYIWNLERKTITKVTSTPELDQYPVWSRDSRFVIFRSGRTDQMDIYRRAADGTGSIERITDSKEAKTPLEVLADGRLLYRRAPVDTAAAGPLEIIDLQPGAKPVAVFKNQPAPITSATVSPDGRWLAYQSVEGSTVPEIHVRPFPNVDDGHWQITSGFATRPMWSRSTREMELFFYTGTPPKLMRAKVQPSRPGGPFVYDAPEAIFEVTRYRLGQVGRSMDISPDGKRFLLILPAVAGTADRMSTMTVVNWAEELRSRVPTGRMP